MRGVQCTMFYIHTFIHIRICNVCARHVYVIWLEVFHTTNRKERNVCLHKMEKNERVFQMFSTEREREQLSALAVGKWMKRGGLLSLFASAHIGFGVYFAWDVIMFMLLLLLLVVIVPLLLLPTVVVVVVVAAFSSSFSILFTFCRFVNAKHFTVRKKNNIYKHTYIGSRHQCVYAGDIRTL